MSTINRRGARNRGFTVLEVIISAFIASLLLGALLRFLVAGHPISQITYLQIQSTETARLLLKRMAKELREIRESETGAYQLVKIDPQRIIFYADIDGDSLAEKVRYELVDTSLIKGVTKPTGYPPVYDASQEVVNTVATNIRNGATPIFKYYNGDYPGDTTLLGPSDIINVKYIQFTLIVDVDPNMDPPPVTVMSQVQLRNLKTNLGEGPFIPPGG